MRTMGAVLTGGRSSRFGSDKGAALLGGRTLIDHAAAAIAPFVETVVPVGGADGVADQPAPGWGPLGGIAGALDHAAGRGFDGVVTIGCDMPRLPDGLIEALLRRSPSYCTQAPLLGHWPVDALEGLLKFIEEHREAARQCGPIAVGDRSKTGPSVKSWTRAIGAAPVASPCPIPNVNTPADLIAL